MALNGIGTWLQYRKNRPVTFPYSHYYYITENIAKKRIARKKNLTICELLETFNVVIEYPNGKVEGKNI